ncbi:MAG: hypothetical protein RR865_11570 [Clostridia bacterium]
MYAFFCKLMAFVCILALGLPLNAVGESAQAPILHVRQGNVDAEMLISQIAPAGTDVKAILSTKQVIDDYGEDIGNQKAHEDVYTLEKMCIRIQEPAGEMFIEWDSPAQDEYLRVDQEQRAKYDPDGDEYLDDQETYLRQQNDVSEDAKQQSVQLADACALNLATQLGLELIPNNVSSIANEIHYPDGQVFSMGQAKYGVKRNGLPVETLGLWSAVSSTGYYVKGESITIEWCNNEIFRASIVTYQVESEESMSGEYISQEAAQKAVETEIETMRTASGNEPVVDLCYMTVPDRKGGIYALLVPAWRFRFLGEYREEDNCHRVNAYTGEIIR